MTGVTPIGHASGSSCRICWEDLAADAVEVVSCKHQFHSKCALAWFDSPDENHRRCPTCRLVLFEATQQRPIPLATLQGVPAAEVRTRDDQYRYCVKTSLNDQGELQEIISLVEDRLEALRSLRYAQYRLHQYQPVANATSSNPQPVSHTDTRVQATVANVLHARLQQATTRLENQRVAADQQNQHYFRQTAEYVNRLCPSNTQAFLATYQDPITQYHHTHEPHVLTIDHRNGHHTFVPLSQSNLQTVARPSPQL